MMYRESVYAGVLGKLIGVYLGRPVEGWPYGKIRESFDMITDYVHTQCGVPLIVADDDISGTFGFFRALENADDPASVSAGDFGNTWLNYVVEDKSILWWGGFGRSTEHTAYINLKRGIPAPQSGSAALNGTTLANQIGAQIFIEALAMACPNDPARAVDLVRKSASVSHDGLAVDAACYLAAMVAMAFSEKDLNVLMDSALSYVKNPELHALVADVRALCAQEQDFRRVRDALSERYENDRYPGACHIALNHAAVLAMLLLGGDDFHRSVSLAASAGWDTDCNAGNVGCLNGVRLGLSAINEKLRAPVADRMYVVTADGGSVVNDAVRQTRRICQVSAKIYRGAPPADVARYAFELPGAVQGFMACPHEGGATATVENVMVQDGERALRIQDASGECCVSVETFPALDDRYTTLASPSLYETQTVTAAFAASPNESISVTPYVLHYDRENRICRYDGEPIQVDGARQVIAWTIPDLGGMPILRLGYHIKTQDGKPLRIHLCSVDWRGAPRCFAQRGMLMDSIWNTAPYWLRAWTASAKQFAADFRHTYCVSHAEADGLATIGTQDWQDYQVETTLHFSLHRQGGVVARSNGHRRYYALMLSGWNTAVLVCRKDGTVRTLASVPFAYAESAGVHITLSVQGDRLRAVLGGAAVLEAQDGEYSCGGAGFCVDTGTMTANNFIVRALEAGCDTL